MKKTLLLLGTFLLILSGCNGSSNDNSQTTPPTDKISKIIVDRTGRSIDSFVNSQKEIISSQELLNVKIADLQEYADNINPNANEDKNQILSWIEILKTANIDFNKERILIYTFEEGAMCEYTERTLLKDSQKAEIIFSQVQPACDLAMTYYFLAYKVSKEIKKVGIQAFEQKYVEIDME